MLRINLKTVLTLMALGLIACNSNPSMQLEKPNVLIILVDDMGYSDISCFGSEIPTPNIDKLAQHGMRMTQFNNAARCCPSRAALLTGLYPHQAGMGHQNRDRHIPSYRGKIMDNATTIAELLSLNGYKTYQVGKWHVGNERDSWPDKKGFNKFFTLIEGAMNYYNNWPWVEGQDSLELTYNGEEYEIGEEFYATSAFTDTANSFLKHHDQSEPFFMYLAYNAPHWPLHAPQEDIDKYRGKFLIGWDSLRTHRFEKMKEIGIIDDRYVLSERFHSVPAWISLSDSVKVEWDLKMALYAAVMENLDEGIGQVYKTLQETGQLENTMIIFLSDNGGSFENPVPKNAPWSDHPTDGLPGSERSFPSYGTPWANVSNTPFSYFKSYLHQGGIATPLIVHYTGKVPAGDINTKTVGYITDLMPTILEFTGTEYPEKIGEREITPIEGISLLPAFFGDESVTRDTIFWEHQFNKAIRIGDWKLVSAYKILDKKGVDNKWELYNMAQDPAEHDDLSKQNPEQVLEMNKLYENWAKKVGVFSPEEMKKAQEK